MAFGTGVSRAAQRLREGERAARRRAVETPEIRVVIKRLVWLDHRLPARARVVVGDHAPACAGSRVGYVPAEVVDRWSGNVRAAVNEGRDAMRAREAELKGGSGRSGGK